MRVLKVLVAVTCLVVIGGVGYFIVSDMNAKKASKAHEARQQKAQACEERAQAMERGHLSGDDLTVLINCRINGAMTEDRMDRAITAAGRRGTGD